jgi:hypothetical protein
MRNLGNRIVPKDETGKKSRRRGEEEEEKK